MDLHQDDDYDFLECSICLSTMSDIVTPFSSNRREGDKACTHGFCFSCLSSYFKLKSAKGPVDCPVCRETFDGFIFNKLANRIFETSKKYSSATKVLENELEIQKREFLKHIEELKKKENDNGELNDRLRVLEDERLDYQTTMRKLEDRLKDRDVQLQNERHHNNESTNQMKNHIKELQMTVTKLEGSYSNQITLSKQLEDQLATLNDQNREMMGKTQMLESSIQTVSNEKRALVERFVAAERRASDQERNVHDRERTVREQTTRMEQYRVEMERQRLQYEFNIEESSKSGEKISDLEGALSCVKVEQYKLETQIETLRAKNRTLEKELEEIHHKNALSQSQSSSALSSFISKSMTDGYMDMIKKSSALSSLFGQKVISSGSSAVIPYRDIVLYEKRGSNKNGGVIRISTPKLSQAVLKSINYQVQVGMSSYYPFGNNSSTSLDQDPSSFRESMLLSRLCHANLLRLENITRDDNGRYFAILSPFVPYDLDYMLASRRSRSRIVPAVELKFVAYQLLVSLNYLHSQEVAHRNIKPTSILVFDDYQIKLCSFSLACSILLNGSDNNNNVNNIPRFSNYSPPEVLLTSGMTTTKSIDWKAVDSWSCGCVLAEMALSILQSPQQTLFSGTDRKQLIQQICDIRETSPIQGTQYFKDLKIGLNVNPTKSLYTILQPTNMALSPSKSSSASESVSKDYIDLIRLLLQFDPSSRISPLQALQHRFFENESYIGMNDDHYNDIASSLTDRNIKEFLNLNDIK